MARRSKTNKKRTRMKKSKKGGENTSEKKRATKTMQKYRRGTLGRRKASSRRMAQGINKGLDTLDPLLKDKILAMSGRGKRKKKTKRKKNRKVKRVKRVTK